MATYCITAARPKNAANHLKSEFKLWKSEEKNDQTSWSSKGWKSAADIAALLEEGNEVLTAKQNEKSITRGTAVEIELRISKNETNYKISDMPDK